MLAPTPTHLLTDREGRPYFLWDLDMALSELKEKLRDPDVRIRAYLLGKIMRQAKPDDVLTLVDRQTIEALFPLLLPQLGNRRAFWSWFIGYRAG